MQSTTRPFGVPKALSLGLFALALATGQATADASYFDRFEGAWKGSGKVQRDVDPDPRSVSCSVTGNRASENAIAISGSCRAAVVFTRKIGAELQYDPASDRFSGTYTGSNTGPARLSGRLRGDALVLTITYAKAIYGDRNATMTIANAGGGRFSMIVTDQKDGATIETSNIAFSAQ